LIDQKRVSKHSGPTRVLHYFVATSDAHNKFKSDNANSVQKYSRYPVKTGSEEPTRKYKFYEADEIVIKKVPYSEYTSYEFRDKDSKPKSAMHWVAAELEIQNSKDVQFLQSIHING
jgi:hypothetical protein